MNRSTFYLFLLFAIVCMPLSAQGTGTTYEGARPSMKAIKIVSPPGIDGEVLNDQLWQAIPQYNDLIQSQPNFGYSATQRTDIRIAYTGLFVVYNHNLRDGDPLNNSFIIKYTRMFDLVK